MRLPTIFIWLAVMNGLILFCRLPLFWLLVPAILLVVALVALIFKRP